MSGEIVYAPPASGNGHNCMTPASVLHSPGTVWWCECGAYWERMSSANDPTWTRISARRVKRRVKERNDWKNPNV